MSLDPPNLIWVMPAKGARMETKERTWGVTLVPERLRTLSALDIGLLWGSLGVSLLVLVAGTLLAPLGLARALLAIAVGALVGCALLGLAGLIGAERRLPGMVLLRAPLGRRGSYLPTALNVLQNLGWATFELIVIATAASALADRAFGFEERWVWVLVFGTVTVLLALAGPILVARRFIRQVGVWAVAASVGYLAWWALDGAALGTLWSAEPEGGLAFWQGVDLTVAMAASWLPLAADYTRFSRTGRGAFWGTATGYLVPLIVLYALGALLFLSRGLHEPTALLTAVAGGSLAGALALLALTVDETDEPFANVYSAAVSVQNVLPWAPQQLVILCAGAAATLGALAVDLARYESFLFLLGSFFVPLFGVLAADFFRGEAQPVAVRWSGLGAWAAGFVAYHWIQPTGPAWWSDLVAGLPGSGEFTGGASVPSFVLAFAAYAGLRYARVPLGRRRARLAGSR
jgi:nucleobase:cation symporter-1, NCS1 family